MSFETFAFIPTGILTSFDDPLTRGVAWFTVVFGLLSALWAVDGSASRVLHRFWLLLASMAGVVLASVANDFVVVVAAMELAALPATIVLFKDGTTPASRASAFQSLVSGIVATVLLIAGLALLFLLTRTTSLSGVRDALAERALSADQRALRDASCVIGDVGCVLILAGLGVRFLAAPFQLAAAEIFDGAKPWAIGLTVVFPRAASLVLMVRVLVNGLPGFEATVQTALTGVAILTMAVGGLIALAQIKVRRLLAFTAVAHSGLVLAALAAACWETPHQAETTPNVAGIPGGVGAACFDFAFDSLALLGLLAILASQQALGGPIDEIAEFAARVRRSRVATGALCALLFSLAGFPPLAGFWSRLWIMKSLLSTGLPSESGFLPHPNVGFVIFAMAAAASLILVAACYLGVVGRLFNDPSESFQDATISDPLELSVLRRDRPALPENPGPGSRDTVAAIRRTTLVGVIAAAAVVAIGVFPGAFARGVARATTFQVQAAAEGADSSPTTATGKEKE